MNWKDLGWLGGPAGAYVTGAWDPFKSGTGNTGQRQGLMSNAGNANAFGQQGAANYNAGTGAINANAAQLQALASGQNSISAEQLRQSLQQNQASQMSMAAGASPQNAGMAARTAMIQNARMGGGLAGQQATAGLQERQQAQQALSQLLLGQRGQDVSAATGGYGAANQGYGAALNPNGDKSWWDKYGGQVMGAITGAGGMGAGGAGGAPTGGK